MGSSQGLASTLLPTSSVTGRFVVQLTAMVLAFLSLGDTVSRMSRDTAKVALSVREDVFEDDEPGELWLAVRFGGTVSSPLITRQR